LGALRSWFRLLLLWLPVPSRWRLPLFDLLYRLNGRAFAGQAHYEAWRRDRAGPAQRAAARIGAAAPAAVAGRRGAVIFVDQYLPRPDRDAGSRAVWQVIETFLSEGLAVRFWPNYQWYEPGYTERLQGMGVQVLVGRQGPRRFGPWLRGQGGDARAVFLVRPLIAREYIPLVRANSDARVLFCGHDIQYERLRLMAETMGRAPGAEQRWMARLEPRIWKQSDIVYYPSDSEVQAVRQADPGIDVRLLPLYSFTTFATPRPARLAQRPALLVVANFGHAPNVDGVRWFVQEVLPLLRARLGAFTVEVVGADPPADAVAAAGAGVNWLGGVSDARLDELYGSCDLALVPLRFGAGVKGKVVESLRWGLPLVTTPTGIQGLSGLERIVCLTETAQQFAAGVERLLADPPAAAAMSAAMIDFARERFSREVVRQALRF
jgi:glycosyltransferase involved in cell wall biosynthesis